MIANLDVRALVERAKEKVLETSHTRKASICEVGRKGLCCNVCSEGPCRITEKNPYGICRLNADQIVAKNLLDTLQLVLHATSMSVRTLQEL
ncbi:MAG: hypothetical protein DRP01_07295 [Archaeoglobales archaeon]|nr:MAG: hypothetical protein DRP01_07295 [Archaeoglobales archaeon]